MIADLAWGTGHCRRRRDARRRHPPPGASHRGAGARRACRTARSSPGSLVGVLAVGFRATADRPVDLVLFSGQAELPAVIAEGSAGVLVLLVVAKGLAYALSLGAGFRGGPVFPAIAIGVAAATGCRRTVLPGLDTTPAVAAGIAAGTTAVLRVPFTAVLLVSLLMGASACRRRSDRSPCRCDGLARRHGAPESRGSRCQEKLARRRPGRRRRECYFGSASSL